MDINNTSFPWLELIDYPAFCVKDGVIIAANTLAEQRQFSVGADINRFVTEHREAYQTFEKGSLYLTVDVCGIPFPACVTRTQECDIFHIRRGEDDSALQALALAASQLRIPLANVMASTDHLLSNLENPDSNTRVQAGQINQNLYRLLRIISNMSDASDYALTGNAGMQTTELVSFISEVMEKAQTFFTGTDITLAYTGPSGSVFGTANTEKLERAIYNLLSNAAKFSQPGSTVTATLAHSENRLIFTLCNTIPQELSGQTLWQRYRREPGIEDPRYGLGLGMTLVSAAAALHGGTVLVDHPVPEQTRVTMTIPVVKGSSDNLRSPVLRLSDYAGGRDIGLIELAEVLPYEIYQDIN